VSTSQLVWGVRQLRKDNEILKLKVEIFSTAERLCVSYVVESLTRPDMTSSVSTKNAAVKTYKDALCHLAVTRCPRIRQFLLILCCPRRTDERNGGSPCNIEEWYCSSAAVTADDGFVPVQRTKARKEIASTVLQSVGKREGKELLLSTEYCFRS
jgi:hypothetical protein